MKFIIADNLTLNSSNYCKQLQDLNHQVMGIANGGEELVKLCKLHQPDYVLTDINMKPGGGFDATIKIKKQFPHIKVICVTAKDLKTYIYELTKAGANGYLYCEAKIINLDLAIARIEKGESYIDDEIIKRLLKNIDDIKQELRLVRELKDPEELTEWKGINVSKFKNNTRLAIIVSAIYYGKTHKEIADKLSVQKVSIDKYIQRFIDKGNFRNTAEMVRYFVETGMVKQDFETAWKR